MNSAPEVINSGTTAFIELNPVLVDSAITVNDSDGDSEWDGGKLSVQITQNSEADDTLYLPTSDPGGGAIWLDTSDSNAVKTDSTTIGTADSGFVTNNATWTITFDSDATNNLVQKTARAIYFNNTSHTPGTDDRTVTFTATDNHPSDLSDTQIVTVTTIDPPTLTTDTATNLSVTGATLNGTANAKGYSTVVTFEYGLSDSYGTTVTADESPITGSTNTSASRAMSGLTSGATYHYRIVGVNDGGTSYGDDTTFTTLKTPTVTTQAVTSIANTTATGNGNITGLGDPNPTAYGVCWSTSSNPVVSGSHTDGGAASATGAFTSAITGLTAGTTYYVRAYATNSAGTSYGNEITFATTTTAATVTTQAVTTITNTTATGNGNITNLGDPNPTAYGVCWSTSSNPVVSGSHTDGGAASATGAFTSAITGLTAGTTYYVRAYATNSAGTSYGNEITFATTTTAATVTTQAVTTITNTTATGNGNITNLGDPNPTAYGVCWSTSSNPVVSGSHTDGGAASATGAFTSAITGLTAGTTYYVRAYATNSAGTSYGNEITFATTTTAATVTTQAVTTITNTTATGNGNITNLGDPNPTAYGVCWSTSSNPVVSGSHTDGGAASATGAFTSAITGLTAGTTYYVRAYATNSAGTSYGNEITFATTTTAATVTTQAVTTITNTTATGNGNITNLGDPNPTAYGVCWSTSSNPVVSGSHTDGGAASATGAFTSAITGLTAGTTYYVRAYATNSTETSYGNEVSFTTSKNAGIIVSSLSSTTTDEGGATATFTVTLDAAPTDDVVISLNSSDPSEGTISPTSLTFTSANWDTDQTVTVTGANDDLFDGNIAYTVEIGPALSADPDYNGIDPSDKYLTNNDNDLDSDGDGISDALEGTGDCDGDGIDDCHDYDPTGYLYDSTTGEIISGGGISVSGPGNVSFISGQNGADGYYQFVVDQTGTYTITVTPPAGYSVDSSGCAASSVTLTANSTPNPRVIGSGEDGATGYLADYNCGSNNWYLTINIQDTTPLILNNNIPLVSNESIPTLNEWGMIITSCLLALAALVVMRRREEF